MCAHTRNKKRKKKIIETKSLLYACATERKESFSEKMQKQNLELKSFLSKYFYKHDKVNEMSEKGRRVVEDLFDFFTQQPVKLPFNWKESRIEKLPRLITDYIAGMTDRYALQQHKTFCE